MAKTTKTIKITSMDEYIADFPKDIQQMLEAIRATIKKAVPEAVETVKYDIPTFTLNGNLVSFGAWKNHIGFYPAPRGVEAFKTALAAYSGTKALCSFHLTSHFP